MIRPDNPIIVQSDRTIMLHTVTSVTDESGAPVKDDDGRPLTQEHPRFAEARDALASFAELEKSPDYLHTYRITPVSIWNAAALGVSSKDIEAILEEFSCVPVPAGLIAEIEGWVNRYGELRIERGDEGYTLSSRKQTVMEDVLGYKDVAELVEVSDDGVVRVGELDRGTLKQVLIKLGYPVDDPCYFDDLIHLVINHESLPHCCSTCMQIENPAHSHSFLRSDGLPNECPLNISLS